MGDRAGDRLEGWLEDPPWDETERAEPPQPRSQDGPEIWDDEGWRDGRRQRDEDPWV